MSAALLFNRWLPGSFVAAAYSLRNRRHCLPDFLRLPVPEGPVLLAGAQSPHRLLHIRGVIPLLILLGSGCPVGVYSARASGRTVSKPGASGKWPPDFSHQRGTGPEDFPRETLRALSPQKRSRFLRSIPPVSPDWLRGSCRGCRTARFTRSQSTIPQKFCRDVSSHPGNTWRGKASSFEGLLTDKDRLLLASFQPIPGLPGFLSGNGGAGGSLPGRPPAAREVALCDVSCRKGRGHSTSPTTT